MRRVTWIVLSLCLSIFVVGCEGTPAPSPTETPSVEAPAPDKGNALTPEGKKFDPPVKPEALPEGAWYCDMGTVHYARSEAGDHTCPVCKMKLKQKTAGP